MDFSRAECALTFATGKSTSASRLHSLGITICPRLPMPKDITLSITLF
jgi:hypothetical protein